MDGRVKPGHDGGGSGYGRRVRPEDVVAVRGQIWSYVPQTRLLPIATLGGACRIHPADVMAGPSALGLDLRVSPAIHVFELDGRSTVPCSYRRAEYRSRMLSLKNLPFDEACRNASYTWWGTP